MTALPQTEFVRRYGPWAIVAGASEGIGAAFARQLAERGLSLLLIARRTEPLAALAEELRTRHRVEVKTISLDLAAADAQEHAQKLVDEHEVGLLVYNAAFSTVARFIDSSVDDKLRTVDVNVRAPILFAHVVVPQMVQRGRGGVILMSSLTALFAAPYVATYGATKAFNLALGEALAYELAPRGVDVLSCCAGATQTPAFRKAADRAGGKAPFAMAAEDVVKEALAKLPRQGSMIPGRLNRLAAFVLGRLLPRRVAVGIMGRATEAMLER